MGREKIWEKIKINEFKRNNLRKIDKINYI